MGMWGTINFFAIGSEQAQDQAAIFAPINGVTPPRLSIEQLLPSSPFSEPKFRVCTVAH